MDSSCRDRHRVETYVCGGLHLELEGAAAGTEPIGQRIIETPENTEHAEVHRNPRSGFIAYVPVGVIAKGEALVQTGAGRTVECAVCHGSDLKGLGPVPGLVVRSPSYVVRALYDMKQGTRKGLWADLMRPVVEHLSSEDMFEHRCLHGVVQAVSRDVVPATILRGVRLEEKASEKAVR